MTKKQNEPGKKIIGLMIGEQKKQIIVPQLNLMNHQKPLELINIASIDSAITVYQSQVKTFYRQNKKTCHYRCAQMLVQRNQCVPLLSIIKEAGMAVDVSICLQAWFGKKEQCEVPKENCGEMLYVTLKMN